MTPTRLRTLAVASLLLGSAGLSGLAVPAAQATPAPQARAGDPGSGSRSDLIPTRRDAVDAVPQGVAEQVQRTLTSPATREAVAAHRGGGVIVVRAHILEGTRKRDKRRHTTKRQVRKQVKWLNLSYAGGQGGVDTGVRFRLRSISVTKNNRWFHLRRVSQLVSMKKHLHRGNARTLNLYFVDLPGGLLGISTFPWDYRAHKRLDGSIIQYNTVPGGKLAPYNQGDTVVHEVGHWLGLLHTFQGFDGSSATSGCAEPNDYVADTAPEGLPQYQPAPRDSCPGDAFLDPTQNFMDYAPDFYMNQFTGGQAARIAQARAAFRTS